METWRYGVQEQESDTEQSGSSVTKIYDADDDDAQHGLDDGHKVAYIWAANDSSQVTINKILGFYTEFSNTSYDLLFVFYVFFM